MKYVISEKVEVRLSPMRLNDKLQPPVSNLERLIDCCD